MNFKNVPDTRVSAMDHIKQLGPVQVLDKLTDVGGEGCRGRYRTGTRVRQVVKHLPGAQNSY